LQTNLNELFQNFIEKPSLFTKKEALSPTYLPSTPLHREKQIKQLGTILAPTLRNEHISNIMIFGWTGVGKTAVTKFVVNGLSTMAEKISAPIETIYINCKMEKINTEYRLLARVAEELGEKVPMTGLPTDRVYRTLFKTINRASAHIIIILDEIDSMDQASEGLYDLTRINYELTSGARTSIIGISNDLNFIDSIDSRVKSSFSGEELIFPPYNAIQLTDILKQRAEEAFLPATLQPGVIEKCAALAAQEHGDARRALNLLRVAAEIADRTGSEKIREIHVQAAEERIDTESISEVTRTLPKQTQTVLWSIFHLNEVKGEDLSTGNIYSHYSDTCRQIGLTPLTQRRVSDLISELDILGIITAKIISKGRYGRTREISLSLGNKHILKLNQILSEELFME